MDVKLLAVVAALTMVIYAPSSQAKPISLVERCYCRSTFSNIPRGLIQELRIIQTPNCPFQVIAKLKANKEVCVNPESRWVRQFVKSVINKRKTQKAQLKGLQRST
ncbi:chemokine (C-X-C motif) ligand 12a (stromal cell-derived factor 1) isoform X2 [Melanotaenia boesemani]|uniref:chemokine (C-X-C motif) ligand 12a (stromal cell-derived factor 1) isoform X2 n=1 Tax=Melanotaenia boesemani TaxID=1250792 RepID=UPI001C0499BE|nr:chemokine (C-X-C motif) ligand 12a (stromal cell-derived factor 1) isoform X2 [Melanotaenia boesemani]